MSSLPYVVEMVTATLYGLLSDKLIKSGRLTVVQVRKLFNSIGSYGPTIALIGLAFVGCSRSGAIVSLVIAMGLTSATYSGLSANFGDLSPNYVGSLYAVSNTLASLLAFVSPLVTGAVTDGNVIITVFLPRALSFSDFFYSSKPSLPGELCS